MSLMEDKNATNPEKKANDKMRTLEFHYFLKRII